MDLPIIQLTATGLSINGIKKTTRKKPTRPNFLVKEQRQPERDRIFDGDRQHVEDHVAEGIPVKGIVDELDEIIGTR